MHQSITNPGSRYKQIPNWHADTPFLTRPKTFGKKKIDGIMYYRGENGKIYVSELFDKMFKPVKQ